MGLVETASKGQLACVIRVESTRQLTFFFFGLRLLLLLDFKFCGSRWRSLKSNEGETSNQKVVEIVNRRTHKSACLSFTQRRQRVARLRLSTSHANRLADLGNQKTSLLLL